MTQHQMHIIAYHMHITVYHSTSVYQYTYSFSHYVNQWIFKKSLHHPVSSSTLW